MSDTQKKKKPNVPNLRFPGFEGEWESCELGDIAEFSKGVGISKDQRSSEGSPCILYGELYTTYLTEIVDEVVSKTDHDSKGLVKSKANDIIIPASGETAIDISTARCVLRNGVLLGGDLIIIRLNDHDGKFFSYQLNGVRKKDIARIAHGVSIVHLHGNALSHIVVNYPSRREQERISSLLSLIDQRIALQNKVIENYQSLIRAITQVFFGGKSDCPLIPLSELSPNIASGKNKPALGPFPLYGSTGLIGTCTSGTYKGEMILVARVGSIGQIQLINTKGCGITDNTLIVNSGELNQYVYFYLKSFDFQKITSGTTQPLITGSSLKAINVPVLPFQERDSFVKLLEAIERRITLEQSVLRHYLNTKSFFLANLFV